MYTQKDAVITLCGYIIITQITLHTVIMLDFYPLYKKNSFDFILIAVPIRAIFEKLCNET